MREFTFKRRGNEKSPREDLSKIFSFTTTHEILLNEYDYKLMMKHVLVNTS